MFTSITTSMLLYINHIQTSTDYNSTISYKITAIVFLIVFVASAIVPIYLFSIGLMWNLPRRRINKISHHIHLLPFERVIQKLQKEVNLLVSLVTTLDAFTNGQTRYRKSTCK